MARWIPVALVSVLPGMVIGQADSLRASRAAQSPPASLTRSFEEPARLDVRAAADTSCPRQMGLDTGPPTHKCQLAKTPPNPQGSTESSGLVSAYKED